MRTPNTSGPFRARVTNPAHQPGYYASVRQCPTLYAGSPARRATWGDGARQWFAAVSPCPLCGWEATRRQTLVLCEADR